MDFSQTEQYKILPSLCKCLSGNSETYFAALDVLDDRTFGMVMYILTSCQYFNRKTLMKYDEILSAVDIYIVNITKYNGNWQEIRFLEHFNVEYKINVNTKVLLEIISESELDPKVLISNLVLFNAFNPKYNQSIYYDIPDESRFQVIQIYNICALRKKLNLFSNFFLYLSSDKSTRCFRQDSHKISRNVFSPKYMFILNNGQHQLSIIIKNKNIKQKQKISINFIKLFYQGWLARRNLRVTQYINKHGKAEMEKYYNIKNTIFFVIFSYKL
ncbi:hypothetical protein AGLY_012622 [Aphis glycines]|uniref:Uncharacterized protein n=1 Tax=Aphis glycines TaxID=307491 RepID=A0A6G0T912_APHGL|nr:hypothetical protein AGLY_012622 [Aphis glycines]